MVAQENSSNQTTDVLVEDQLQPPLDLTVPRSENSTNQTAEVSVGLHSVCNTAGAMFTQQSYLPNGSFAFENQLVAAMY